MFTSKKQRAIQEIDARRNRIETYTEPLPIDTAKDVPDFLSYFYRNILFERNNESIQNELHLYPNSVGKFYQDLVVGQQSQSQAQAQQQMLAYEDFWQRYYYRTHSIERVMHELEQIDIDKKKMKQQQQKAENSSSSISSNNATTGSTSSISNSTIGSGIKLSWRSSSSTMNRNTSNTSHISTTTTNNNNPSSLDSSADSATNAAEAVSFMDLLPRRTLAVSSVGNTNTSTSTTTTTNITTATTTNKPRKSIIFNDLLPIRTRRRNSHSSVSPAISKDQDDTDEVVEQQHVQQQQMSSMVLPPQVSKVATTTTTTTTTTDVAKVVTTTATTPLPESVQQQQQHRPIIVDVHETTDDANIEYRVTTTTIQQDNDDEGEEIITIIDSNKEVAPTILLSNNYDDKGNNNDRKEKDTPTTINEQQQEQQSSALLQLPVQVLQSPTVVETYPEDEMEINDDNDQAIGTEKDKIQDDKIVDEDADDNDDEDDDDNEIKHITSSSSSMADVDHSTENDVVEVIPKTKFFSKPMITMHKKRNDTTITTTTKNNNTDNDSIMTMTTDTTTTATANMIQTVMDDSTTIKNEIVRNDNESESSVPLPVVPEATESIFVDDNKSMSLVTKEDVPLVDLSVNLSPMANDNYDDNRNNKDSQVGVTNAFHTMNATEVDNKKENASHLNAIAESLQKTIEAEKEAVAIDREIESSNSIIDEVTQLCCNSKDELEEDDKNKDNTKSSIIATTTTESAELPTSTTIETNTVQATKSDNDVVNKEEGDEIIDVPNQTTSVASILEDLLTSEVLVVTEAASAIANVVNDNLENKTATVTTTVDIIQSSALDGSDLVSSIPFEGDTGITDNIPTGSADVLITVPMATQSTFVHDEGPTALPDNDSVDGLVRLATDASKDISQPNTLESGIDVIDDAIPFEQTINDNVESEAITEIPCDKQETINSGTEVNRLNTSDARSIVESIVDTFPDEPFNQTIHDNVDSDTVMEIRCDEQESINADIDVNRLDTSDVVESVVDTLSDEPAFTDDATPFVHTINDNVEAEAVLEMPCDKQENINAGIEVNRLDTTDARSIEESVLDNLSEGPAVIDNVTSIEQTINNNVESEAVMEIPCDKQESKYTFIKANCLEKTSDVLESVFNTLSAKPALIDDAAPVEQTTNDNVESEAVMEIPCGEQESSNAGIIVNCPDTSDVVESVVDTLSDESALIDFRTEVDNVVTTALVDEATAATLPVPIEESILDSLMEEPALLKNRSFETTSIEDLSPPPIPRTGMLSIPSSDESVQEITPSIVDDGLFINKDVLPTSGTDELDAQSNYNQVVLPTSLSDELEAQSNSSPSISENCAVNLLPSAPAHTSVFMDNDPLPLSGNTSTELSPSIAPSVLDQAELKEKYTNCHTEDKDDASAGKVLETTGSVADRTFSVPIRNPFEELFPSDIDGSSSIPQFSDNIEAMPLIPDVFQSWKPLSLSEVKNVAFDPFAIDTPRHKSAIEILPAFVSPTKEASNDVDLGVVSKEAKLSKIVDSIDISTSLPMEAAVAHDSVMEDGLGSDLITWDIVENTTSDVDVPNENNPKRITLTSTDQTEGQILEELEVTRELMENGSNSDGPGEFFPDTEKILKSSCSGELIVPVAIEDTVASEEIEKEVASIGLDRHVEDLFSSKKRKQDANVFDVSDDFTILQSPKIAKHSDTDKAVFMPSSKDKDMLDENLEFAPASDQQETLQGDTVDRLVDSISIVPKNPFEILSEGFVSIANCVDDETIFLPTRTDIQDDVGEFQDNEFHDTLTTSQIVPPQLMQQQPLGTDSRAATPVTSNVDLTAVLDRSLEVDLDHAYRRKRSHPKSFWRWLSVGFVILFGIMIANLAQQWSRIMFMTTPILDQLCGPVPLGWNSMDFPTNDQIIAEAPYWIPTTNIATNYKMKEYLFPIICGPHRTRTAWKLTPLPGKKGIYEFEMFNADLVSTLASVDQQLPKQNTAQPSSSLLMKKIKVRSIQLVPSSPIAAASSSTADTPNSPLLQIKRPRGKVEWLVPAWIIINKIQQLH